MAPRVTAKSTASQVQDAVGLTAVQWSRFLIITANEGQKLLSRSDEYSEVPDTAFNSWRDVPAEPQQKLIDAVKLRLEEEGVRAPDSGDILDRAIRWRMMQAIKGRKSKIPASQRQLEAESSTASSSAPDQSSTEAKEDADFPRQYLDTARENDPEQDDLL